MLSVVSKKMPKQLETLNSSHLPMVVIIQGIYSIRRSDFQISFHLLSRVPVENMTRLITQLNVPGIFIIGKLEDLFERYKLIL